MRTQACFISSDPLAINSFVLPFVQVGSDFFSMMLQVWVFLSEELNADTLIFSQGRQTLLLLGTKLLKDYVVSLKRQPYKLIMVFIVGKVFDVIGINALFEA